MINLKNFIVLADNDGTIRDTNSVKDQCLNSFCEKEFGQLVVSNILPTEIHRQLHGRPMAEIFMKIAAVVYGKKISFAEGQEITERLNLYIRPEYVSRRVFPDAREFFASLKEMKIPLYILTGMEPDLVAEGLNKHGMSGMFDGILGAPKSKEENIAEVLELHKGSRILALGDSMAEYTATMVYPGTIFLAFDFENRAKRVFPDNVNILNGYGKQVWKEIQFQLST